MSERYPNLPRNCSKIVFTARPIGHADAGVPYRVGYAEARDGFIGLVSLVSASRVTCSASAHEFARSRWRYATISDEIDET